METAYDVFVKIEKTHFRHSAEPRIGSGAGAGIQSRSERDFKDSKILWTPVSTGVTIFYENINYGFRKLSCGPGAFEPAPASWFKKNFSADSCGMIGEDDKNS